MSVEDETERLDALLGALGLRPSSSEVTPLTVACAAIREHPLAVAEFLVYLLELPDSPVRADEPNLTPRDIKSVADAFSAVEHSLRDIADGPETARRRE